MRRGGGGRGGGGRGGEGAMGREFDKVNESTIDIDDVVIEIGY
jgi:hypothetical protein